MNKLTYKIIFLVIVLTPLWSFLTWFFWPSQEMSALIIDKTVLDTDRNGHRSFNWILTHEKNYKKSGDPYHYGKDYFGFFPEEESELRIKDLEGYKEDRLDSLANFLDMAYYVDAKGVVLGDTTELVDSTEKSVLLYGGVTENDSKLLEKLYSNGKLVLAEYNTLGYPTSPKVRLELEELFELKFSGWIGRYFSSLKREGNKEIPEWVFEKYLLHTGEEYSYSDVSGIILVHEEGKVVVLENGTHLNVPVPSITTSNTYTRKLDLPDFIKYPSWFDINSSLKEENIISSFKIHTNTTGDSILESFGLSNRFPAVIGDSDKGLHYYFCGDFANNPVQNRLAYFKGIKFFSRLFYNSTDVSSCKNFFWNYYYPLVSNIISDYKEGPVLVSEDEILPNDNASINADSLSEDSLGAYSGEDELLGSTQTESENVIVEKIINLIQDNIGRYRVGGRRMEGADYIASSNTHNSSALSIGEPDENNKQWRVVIASLQSKSGTERYIEQLNDSEISVMYIDYLNTHRITFGPFENLGDSQSKLQQIQQTYPEAWMIKF